MPSVTDDGYNNNNLASSGEMSPIYHNYKRRRGNKSPAFNPPFHEAPARLSGSPLRNFHRQRGQSLSICEGNSRSEAFISLEQTSLFLADLPSLCVRADLGLKWDVDPILADGATGGTYFLRDRNRMIVCVLKPGDEEVNSPHNPHAKMLNGGLQGLWGRCAKGNITPGELFSLIFYFHLFPPPDTFFHPFLGFGMFREVAAYILDDGLAGIPPTYLAKFRHRLLDKTSIITDDFVPGGDFPGVYKLSSVQKYIRHEGCAEDLSPLLFDVGEVMRIAILDVRLCNADRHEGNLLVCLRGGGGGIDMEIDPVEDANYLPFSSPSSAVCVAFSAPQFPTSLEKFLSVSSATPPTAAPNSTSPRSKYRLVPIDHGFVLPHILHTSDATFAWLNWPQIKGPIPEDLRHLVANLDCDADVEKLRHTLGASMPFTSLLTLIVCTTFLKMSVEAGLTLFEIGSAMVSTSSTEPSILHEVIVCAFQKVLDNHFWSPSSPCSPLSHHNRVVRPIALHSGTLSRADTKSCPIPSQLDEASSPRAVNCMFTCFSATNVPLNDVSLNMALSIQDGLAVIVALKKEVQDLVNNLCLKKMK